VREEPFRVIGDIYSRTKDNKLVAKRITQEKEELSTIKNQRK